MKAASLFIGHGSPMLGLEDSSPQQEFLQALGKNLPRPNAILLISAHWETSGTKILNIAQPETIYDFRGFPKELYKIKYPAQVDLKISAELAKAIPEAQLSKEWGIDHGVWTLLMHMYPLADIPIAVLSLNKNMSAREHFELGKKLNIFRDKGLMILGSGNIVHNLRAIDSSGETYDWAREFDSFVKKSILDRDFESLIQYENKGCLAELAAPTNEHFLPLLYVLGASAPEEDFQFPFEGFQLGSISLRSVQIQQQE